MARETLEAKALRLLAEGRVLVLLVDAEHMAGYRRGGWWCDSEAHRFGRRCSHLAALQLVTVRPVRERSAACSRRGLAEAFGVRCHLSPCAPTRARGAACGVPVERSDTRRPAPR